MQGGEDSGEGPMWNKFWKAFGENDTESVHSDTHSGQASKVGGANYSSPPGSDVSGLKVDATSISPNDSASLMAAEKEVSKLDVLNGNIVLEPANIEMFVFKFKSPANRVFRINFEVKNGFSKLKAAVFSKFSPEEAGMIGGIDRACLSFVDDEGDLVTMSSEGDLQEAVALARHLKKDKIDLFVYNASRPHSPVKNRISPPQKSQVDRQSSHQEEKIPIKKDANGPKEAEKLRSIELEKILPIAIAVIGVTVLVGYVFGKNSK